MTIYGEDPAEAKRREMEIYIGGGGKEKCVIQGDGRVHSEKSEQSCAVHSYVNASVTV